MSWETRHGNGRYYTRSMKKNGKTIRQYVGTGLLAELAATQDIEERSKHQAQDLAWKTEQQQLTAQDRHLEALDQQVEILARGALVLAGFRQHSMGEWRKRHATAS